ncbi:MAG: ROK family protein [Candidatus Zixiibacteriota bacterium]
MSEVTVHAGIDIGATSVKFGLFDSTGNVLFREQRPTMADKGAQPLMHMVTNIGESLLYHAAEENLSVSYLGVGTPGAVDFKSGKVIGPCPNIKGWTGIDIAGNLRARLNLPVWVDNDVNAMALAEARFGVAIGADSAICVTVGTGVGGGVIIGGKLWRGSSFSAGELGHLPINSIDGPVCGCGNKGCLEAYCSSRAILNRAKRKLEKRMSNTFENILGGDTKNLTIKKLFTAGKRGDEIAHETIDETARYLAIGLAGIVNLINPEVIVIGGGIADGGGGFLESVSAEVKQRAFSSAIKGLSIVKASLGNDAGFIGAGLLGE